MSRRTPLLRASVALLLLAMLLSAVPATAQLESGSDVLDGAITELSNEPASREIAAAAALQRAAAPVPAVSAADCNDGIPACDLTAAEQTDAAPVTITAVSTVVPLRSDAMDPTVRTRAFSLYLSLLNGSSLPASGAPAIGLDDRTVTDASGAAVREFTVAMRISRDGEDGWQVLSRRTTGGAADQQAVGIPATDGEGMFARMDFSGGAGDADEVLEAYTTRTAPTFGVTPVIEGDTPWKITEAARPTVPVSDVVGSDPVGQDGTTSVTPPAVGEVTYAVAADLDAINEGLPVQFTADSDGNARTLADLIDLEGTAPGMSWATDALLVTQADNTEDDTGPLPVAVPPLPTGLLPTAPGGLTVGANNVTTGQFFYANNSNVIAAGTQLQQTNVDTTAHPVVCSDEDGKVRKDLCDTDGFNNTGELLPVEGTEDLPPGAYFYICRVHGGNPSQQTGMWGTLTVVG